MGEFKHKSKATAEKSSRAAEQSYLAATQNMREYSLQVIEMAQANADASFELQGSCCRCERKILTW
jgi:hypothetical protein